MSRRFAFGLLWTLVTLLLLAAVGAYAYHLGTLATISATQGAGNAVHPYGGWGWGPGFFFFPFGFLIPVFFFLLFFLGLRFLFFGLFWPRRWYGGPGDHAHREDPRRELFEEWHRRAHGEAPPTGDEPPRQP